MPPRMISTGATFTLTGTTPTNPFQIPGFNYQPTNEVGYYIEGTDAADYLWGSAKNDTMHGYAGNDVIYGEGGNDTIFGENGNDFLDGGAGADILNGGAGIDTTGYQTSSTAVTVQLSSGGAGGDAQGDTYSGIENVIGSIYSDTIVGDANDNRLEGGDGNDTIIGGGGNDVIVGGRGSNMLYGDSGGVYGNDIFVLEKRSGYDVYSFDTLMDFGYGDKLQLKGFSISDLGTDGKLAQADSYDEGYTLRGDDIDASDKLFYAVLESTLYYGDVVQDENGFWHLTNRQVVADFSGINSVHAEDLIFA